MDGFLIFSSRTGVCLYSQEYTEGFGLESKSAVEPGVQSCRGPSGGNGYFEPKSGGKQAINLSGVLYALNLQAQALVMEDVTDGQGEGEISALQNWTVGDCTLHFCSNNELGVMAVLFASNDLGDDIPEQILTKALSAYTTKYEKKLRKGNMQQGKCVSFTNYLHKLYQ
ncbi:hypothetical protein CYMTET_51461, partial [Cymbomonas tetramitiformis]|eukprot:gene6912-8246_t